MKAALKKQWVKALRSGKYVKGRGKLCDVSGPMCCLGVLIDIGIDGEWELEGTDYTMQGMYACPSETMRAELGLTEEAAVRLIHMNDNQGVSFAEIADWIEANL